MTMGREAMGVSVRVEPRAWRIGEVLVALAIDVPAAALLGAGLNYSGGEARSKFGRPPSPKQIARSRRWWLKALA
jgi:hypothetical protein